MALQQIDSPIIIGSGDVQLSDAIRTHAEEKIRKVAGDYFGRLNQASVHFSSEGKNYRCSVQMRMGALPMAAGEAQANDVYAAFDGALAKVAKQLRRKKRELRD